MFVVLGNIDSVEAGKILLYNACNVFHHKVFSDSNLYYCHSYARHVVVATPRYRINVCVIDEIDSTVFTMFDRDAHALLGRTCADFIEHISIV